MPSASAPRPDHARHRDDYLIAVAGLLGGLTLLALGLTNGDPLPGLPRWPAVPALVALSGAELLRRTHPQTALLIGTPALVVDTLTGGLIASIVMFTDLVYSAVLYGSPAAARRIPRITELLTVLATIVPLAVIQRPEALLIGVVIAFVTVAPAWTAVLIRNHRDTAETAELRAEQTALLAEMDRREAVIAERARMARELHDLVANHLSAIAIHSTAALSIDEPAAGRQALTVIRENSVQGLAEMRRMIGLLRDAGAESAPAAAPTLDGLDALLRQARTAAAAVGPDGTGEHAGPAGEDPGLEFRLRDERPPQAPPLPAPVELAAYRIVQEAVTNALKHAAPGEVVVKLSRTAPAGGRSALRVEVVSPLGGRPGPRAPGSGAGLIGMRERVALLGGEFEAGPSPAEADADGPGGAGRKVWRVRAVLPVEEGSGS
ncbi:two-component sensor histidine kinase [Streptomyces pactum]|uniref:histidine kinase n=1 Tax=Streptomyces pactum TaxID=68249 RepID=A0ABS0NPA0_9ACTN|nr:histidine kinase [Streptomyces pactum]MBH5337029.1 two-component sensor histidine kinase [Streptomyces pactum]